MLPRGDIDCMNTFMLHLKTLLGVLGHLILEEKLAPTTTTREVSTPSVAETSSGATVFTLTTRTLTAKAIITNEGVVVLSGSQAAPRPQPNLSPGYIRKREELVTDGVLIPESDHMVFTREYLFTSPSAASSVIIGSNSSGPQYWTTDDGKTLKEIESSFVTTLVTSDPTAAPIEDANDSASTADPHPTADDTLPVDAGV